MKILEDLVVGTDIEISQLPEKTGILSAQTSTGIEIYNLIIKSGRKFNDDITLCSRRDYQSPSPMKTPRITVPRKELFQAAIDYILDNSISSTDIIHKTFKFNYEELDKNE